MILNDLILLVISGKPNKPIYLGMIVTTCYNMLQKLGMVYGIGFTTLPNHLL